MGAADGFVGAGAVAVLLVHFDGYGGAGWDAAFGGGGALVGVAADVVVCYGGDGAIAVG